MTIYSAKRSIFQNVQPLQRLVPVLMEKNVVCNIKSREKEKMETRGGNYRIWLHYFTVNLDIIQSGRFHKIGLKLLTQQLSNMQAFFLSFLLCGKIRGTPVTCYKIMCILVFHHFLKLTLVFTAVLSIKQFHTVNLLDISEIVSMLFELFSRLQYILSICLR